MKKNLLLLNLFLLFIVFPAFVFAQTLDDKLKEIDAYAEKVRTDWNVPGFAVGIVKDDKVVFLKGYGVRELNKPDKVDEHTLFAIASNSKAFTAASLAILVDQGKLNWDDKVIKYLPDFQMYDSYVTGEMTVRDLVSHRSGLDTFSGDLLWYETTYTNDEILRRVRFLKPTYGFRAGYGYSNVMFIAAGRVVEKVSGKPWAQFVRENILTPIGMNETKTSIFDYKTGDNVAVPHNESGGKLRALPQGNVDGAAGAVRLNSSVSDMTKWLRLQLGRGKFDGKQIFSERQSGEMWSPNTPIKTNPFPAKDAPTQIFSAYGMGWFLQDYRGRKIIQHSGGLDGMISQTAMMPSENLGLVVLTNSETGVISVMMNKIFDVFLNVEPKRDWSAERLKRAADGKLKSAEADAKIVAARIPNTKPTLPLSSYAGKYTDQLYGDATIAEENGKLVLRFTQSPNFVADLESWNYDTFQIHWRPSVSYNFPRGFVTFTIDKNGATDEMKIDQPNNDFWFYELHFKRSEK
ncbi:MAG: serine hydrolase [Acidobacteriota bacterium]|nr:serine hydrolase [Acidobacteriota bacterium]